MKVEEVKWVLDYLLYRPGIIYEKRMLRTRDTDCRWVQRGGLFLSVYCNIQTPFDM